MLVSALIYVSRASAKNIFLATVPISCVRSLSCVSNYKSLTSFITEETRIRWVQTQNSAEALFTKIKDLINSGVYRAEDALHRLMSLLSGGWEGSKGKANAGYENVKHAGDSAYEHAKSEWEETKRKSGNAYDTSAGWAEDIVDEGREKVGEKVKVGGQKIKGEL